jgi:hypothetical protein
MKRTEYQANYHALNSDRAKERKQNERDRRERCRSYWYAKLILNREMPALIADCSPEMIEQERKKYLTVLEETE